jgi:hypothetical protein
MTSSKLSQILLGLIAIALSAGTVRAEAQTPARNANQPDVSILIFSMPNGPDQIGLTYPGVVPHAQAMRDVKAIQQAAGWNVTGVQVSDQLPPISAEMAKKLGKMTEVDFVAPGAVPLGSRYLPVEPFVNSLRSYRHVTLTYLVGTDFAFEGLRSYADPHVKIALDQRGSTYTYQILYHDGSFGHLSLPRYQLSSAAARSSALTGHRRAVNPWLVALIAVAAVGAGCIAYAVFARSV